MLLYIYIYIYTHIYIHIYIYIYVIDNAYTQLYSFYAWLPRLGQEGALAAGDQRGPRTNLRELIIIIL